MATDAPERVEADDEDDESGSAVPHPAFEPYAAESPPAATVGAPGKGGCLELTFAPDADGETRMVRDLARTPFHVSGTLGHDPYPGAETVFVQSPSGGVAQGDRHDVTVTARSGAVAHVTTASSTKVLSMTHNYAAADVSLSVGADAHLDYVPEPTILHPDARFAQETRLDVDPAGSAVVGEVVVPGRLARGEYFDFEQYLSRLRVRSDGDLLVDDATHLRPAESDPSAAGVMGEFAVLGTLYVVAPAADADALSDRLHGAAVGASVAAGDDDGDTGSDTDDTVRAGATALPNDAGVAVRALGHRAETVTAALRAAWGEAREELLGVGAPDARRP
ncbi:urease accessory protein UreD [Halobacteriales archaeon SW_7_68_16]|nr:MAG: urease accessory protein UreD [Halobacteriales archaeon SW_7_68_16]